jgi:hypothetical protein
MKTVVYEKSNKQCLGRNEKETEKYYKQYLERMQNAEKVIESISLDVSKRKLFNSLSEKIHSIYVQYEMERKKAPNRQ